MKIQEIRPCFVSNFPPVLEEGVLYISEEHHTAGHLCCCGCREKVITPLNPAKWRLVKSNGGCVSLYPSIGNWKFSCQSHYWIHENRIIDAGKMSKHRIEAVKIGDKLDNERYIAHVNRGSPSGKPSPHASLELGGLLSFVLKKLRAWWNGQ
ncbi:hypothetical protein C798_00645 [Herbaspirillum rubrisubalbicans Os34]|uniref:Uncharacterized protein n=1 Tax=Herbaspirillum rubrisubalbicans Os34 TaxID=1235827 RepID=A0A6M3ZJC7_9BURK|nr:DUF6527 family protein [Herbaspirillum rubrisubalbicans]QJP98788.1 hypothetical protein C798_00645 [Herbaspirillum rubrisubalbicans Os34]